MVPLRNHQAQTKIRDEMRLERRNDTPASIPDCHGRATMRQKYRLGGTLGRVEPARERRHVVALCDG
jgi:uncharacterized protein with von Willebrand factor type A (vWA) domain